MKTLFHKHDWEVQEGIYPDAVRRCKCHAVETRIFDYDKVALVWVPGNFFQDRRDIYVSAGSYEEYEELKNTFTKEPGNFKYIFGYDTIKYVSRPSILFWGTWYLQGYWEDPRMTQLLNSRK